MLKTKKLIYLIVVGLGVTFLTTAYGKEIGTRIEQKQDIQSYSIAYYDKNEISYENSGNDVNEKSVFELASNGKVVTAYITMKLIEEGKINLEDKMSSYIDAKLLTDDTRMNTITIKQLLCHTAGFSPSFELGVDKKIYSAPGEKFRYSGVGYIYLQNVIENASGMTLEQAAQHYVFKPLGMENSTFEYAKTVTPYIKLSSVVIYSLVLFIVSFIILLIVGSIIGLLTKYRFFSFKGEFLGCLGLAASINILFLLFKIMSKVLIFFLIYAVVIILALFITRRNKRLFYACVPALTTLIIVLGLQIPVSIPVTQDVIAQRANSAYTLKSTSEDMALFCQELMKEYDSGDGVASSMFSSVVEIDANNSWGLGIGIEKENTDNTYWHSGINPGFQSLLVLDSSQDKFIIVLTNSDNGLELCKQRASNYLEVKGNWDIPR